MIKKIVSNDSNQVGLSVSSVRVKTKPLLREAIPNALQENETKHSFIDNEIDSNKTIQESLTDGKKHKVLSMLSCRGNLKYLSQYISIFVKGPTKKYPKSIVVIQITTKDRQGNQEVKSFRTKDFKIINQLQGALFKSSVIMQNLDGGFRTQEVNSQMLSGGN